MFTCVENSDSCSINKFTCFKKSDNCSINMFTCFKKNDKYYICSVIVAIITHTGGSFCTVHLKHVQVFPPSSTLPN